MELPPYNHCNEICSRLPAIGPSRNDSLEISRAMPKVTKMTRWACWWLEAA
jgi:hypothetical protein